MKKQIKIITLLLILTFSLQSFGQYNYEPLKEEFSKKIEKKMRKKDVTGASVVLIVDDSIVWQKNFGYTNKEKKIPVTDQTQFKIGSVSKLFTGVASMQLAEEGNLNLDTPVKKYVPEFAMKTLYKNAPPINSRMILTHHAGFPSDILRGFESDNPEPYTKELDYLNMEYAISAPNVIHAYSNPGFNFMGILNSRIYGKSYEDMTMETIFKPLLMSQSGFWGISNDEHLSPSYNSKGKPITEKYLRQLPAGGIVSTTTDLAKFIINMLPKNESNTILKTSTIKNMMTTQNSDIKLDFGNEYGIVWMKRLNNKCGDIVHHGGATIYHRAMLALAPETNMGVAILTNSENGNALCGLYDDMLNKASEINQRAVDIEKEEKERPKKKVELSETQLAQLEGYYGFPYGLIHLEQKRGKLHGKFDKTGIAMIPVDSNMFIPRIKILGPIGFKIKQVRFYIEEINGMQVLTQEQVKSGYKNVIARKTAKPEFTAAWKERVGKYEIVNYKEGDFEFCKNFELKNMNGVPVFAYQITIQGSPVLQPVLIIENDKMSYTTGLGRQGGYAVQALADENGEEYLYFSGFRLKRIKNEAPAK